MSFAVYKASAGSGKTFSLVREYLKIVLEEPGDFRHILAITFTNKVANEMKERVLKALAGLAGGAADGKDKMLPLLLRETGLSKEIIALRAGEALELILHHYSDFAIGTIDSFSHRIIRTFAHDFGLPVNFNVEMDTDALLETTVDLLLDRIGDDRELTGLLVDFVESRIDEEHDWRIDRELVKFSKNILDEQSQEYLISLRNIPLEDFRKISASVNARAKKITGTLESIGAEALELIRSKGIPLESFYYGKAGIPSFFLSLAKGEPKAPGVRARTTMEEDRWEGKSCTPADRASIGSVKERLKDLCQRALETIERDGALLALLNILKRTIYPLAVLNEIARILEEFKRQNNIVHISEFNTRISRIIMGEPVPFIYERLGERYRHILIDEFQDTSAMQWMNFLPLIENALASGHFNLVVGDGKQAIYRFRNGDVEQFSSLPNVHGSEHNPVLKQRESALVRNFSAVPLNVNYRSGKEIVEFNNRFFRILTDALFPGSNDVYKDLEQEAAPEKKGGYISIEIPGNGDEDADYSELMLRRTIEIVNGAVADGYAKRDVAILCRSNSNASLVARFLLLNGIDVVSAESLLVSNSPHVAFIVAFIRFLHGLPDPLVHAELAAYLAERGFTGKGLHELLRQIAGEEHPGQGIAGIFADTGIDIRCNELAGLPVYDLAETLIRLFRMNDPPDPYLQFFLDAVLRFTSRVSTGSRDFLEWWDLNRDKLSIVVPEEIDAVRVMTIHKAKGLQFPVVIYAFAAESKKNTKDWIWTALRKDEVPGLPAVILPSNSRAAETDYADLIETENRKSLLDLVNMLYVAMTRPEERLYLLTKRAPQSGELQSVPKFIAYVLNQMNVFEEDRTVYAFGTTVKKKPPAMAEGPTNRLDSMISGEWRKKIHVKFRAPEMWNMEQPVQSSQWGNRIHTVLSWIITKEDLERALEKAVYSGLIRLNEKEEMEQVIRPLFSHPLLAKLFGSDVSVRTEAEILVPGGLFYRPDRVVFDGEEVFIVDYKTGKQNERHRTQLNQYAALLEEMGYKNLHKLLVYLEPKVNVVRF